MGKIVIKVDYTDNFVGVPANEDVACLVTARTYPELQKEMESSLNLPLQKRPESTNSN